MALVYYETGIKSMGEDGNVDYTNALVTQDEQIAKSASRTDGRNYLARMTFLEQGCKTEFYDADTDTWKA